MNEPFITVIIPYREDEKITKTVVSVRQNGYPNCKIQIIAVSGNQPSLQRNMAAKAAKGEILYFLDNDSILTKGALKNAAKLFMNDKTGVAGGPSLTKKFDNILQKAINSVFSSLFGTGPMRARYTSLGKIRETNDFEIILCNMAIRRKLFARIKGFDVRLYPNEENELINRVLKLGYKVYYHPHIIVYRKQRDTLLKFISQMLNYGRGRAEQTVIQGFGFVPAGITIFFLYFVMLIFIRTTLYKVPLLIYLTISILVSLYESIKLKDPSLAVILPPLFLSTHFCYVLGFITGITKKLLGIKSHKIPAYKIRKMTAAYRSLNKKTQGNHYNAEDK